MGLAQCFLKAGYGVIINYLQDDEQAEKVLKLLDSEDVLLVKADITNEEDRTHLLSTTMEKFGRFDVLINNAGILRLGRFLEISPETFSEVMDCNFNAPFYLTQAFTKALIEKEKRGL